MRTAVDAERFVDEGFVRQRCDEGSHKVDASVQVVTPKAEREGKEHKRRPHDDSFCQAHLSRIMRVSISGSSYDKSSPSSRRNRMSISTTVCENTTRQHLRDERNDARGTEQRMH